MRRNRILLLVAVLMVLTASISGALAYFTSYTTAQGARVISIHTPKTHLEEEFINGTKHVKVINDKDADPVLVRLKAFCGSEYTLRYDSENGSWKEDGDGYWEYAAILNPDSETPELLIHMDDLPKGAQEGDSFNIVVVSETSPVFYTPEGKPYADWALSMQQEGGGQ